MRILSAAPRSEFRVELSFDNGETDIVDLSNLVGRGVFVAWQQPGFFDKLVVTEFGALEWPGELDLCPDALYLQMTGKKPEDIFPTLANRLSNA